MTNPRRSNGTRRDRLVRRVKREENTCHLCGQPVNIQLPAGRPGSPEIDELIPVALGGSPYDRNNCRLAHRWCNRHRWHKPYEPVRQELHANPPTFDAAGQRHDTPLAPIVSTNW
ncbi:HNH endonuclease [Branchiibius hedensis]|uniref:HNH endonuclease n=1 Tax=Branchiibius hedensis TaxID=672460 RepID=A0A2Y9BQ21_9MICO|nr:HNH endonuclease [Branchiibius hedensis]PWJ27530.1 HNH endonuclease [Branchiibius hedensis]SSA36340.1 HNH endonuclease [Branchiibius hedensis]SSA59142.1 HNH endonuclease [Branchiibius hedensis]